MNRPLSWFSKIFLAPIVKGLLIKSIRGVENIPRSNFILATNHQSHLDELATAYICVPRRFHFIGQTDSHKGLARLLVHLFYSLTGVIALNRKNEDSRKWVIREATKVLREGDILIIYPEGTRTRTGEMGQGRFGVARIFLETEVPILPAAIKGAFDVLPPGGKLKLEKNIELNVGKPLFFKEELEKARNLDKNSKEYILLLENITNSLMEEIAKLYRQL